LDVELMEHRRISQQETSVINAIGLLMMTVLVFVIATLMLQKKSDQRDSSSSSVTIRYCKNGGQKFHSVSPSDEDDARNGRIL